MSWQPDVRAKRSWTKEAIYSWCARTFQQLRVGEWYHDARYNHNLSPAAYSQVPAAEKECYDLVLSIADIGQIWRDQIVENTVRHQQLWSIERKHAFHRKLRASAKRWILK